MNPMIDEQRKIIYLDFSMRSTFQQCKEKARLQMLGYRTMKRSAPLDFGHAFHAAIGAYYDAQAGGFFDDDFKWQRFAEVPSAVSVAKTAFLKDLKMAGAILPISLEADERRSVERGLALVEAYIERWANEPYENVLDADGKPLTEIFFKILVAHYEGYDIYYVGTIDRIMRNIMTKRPVIFETKTTGMGLSQFINQCNPNHQVTGYFAIAWPMFPDIIECIWDCIFVSKRQADMGKSIGKEPGARFWMYGVDMVNDFKRQTTSRSKTDVSEFMIDLESDALDYCKWLLSQTARWPRSAPAACHMYDGCQFRDVCRHNGSQEHLNTYFEIKPWNPLKRLRSA